MTRLGFVGLGRMGTPMALRLAAGGLPLVVWNRSQHRVEPLVAAGARAAATPREVAWDSDVVFSMVLDDAAAEATYLGPDGLLSAEIAGKLFVEMSTLRPATVTALGRRIESGGGRLIDAPVSGTVGPAQSGQLLAMAGASSEDLERARPLLECMCRRIVHAGPPGSGALLKLVVNLPLAIYWQALAEAMALGRAGGLDDAAMLETLCDSSAALAVLRLKVPAILAGGGENPAFDLASMQKDLLYMIEAGSAGGVAMPATAASLASYAAASSCGFARRDAVSIVRFVAEHMVRGRADETPTTDPAGETLE